MKYNAHYSRIVQDNTVFSYRLLKLIERQPEISQPELAGAWR